MSVNIYNSTNDSLNQLAGREDTSFWEGTKEQWNALNASERAQWTGKYVIITNDEEERLIASHTYESGDTLASILNDLISHIAVDINKNYILKRKTSTYTEILNLLRSNDTENFLQFSFVQVASTLSDNVQYTLAPNASEAVRCRITASGVTYTDMSSYTTALEGWTFEVYESA